jgi:hypothetical protein
MSRKITHTSGTIVRLGPVFDSTYTSRSAAAPNTISSSTVRPGPVFRHDSSRRRRLLARREGGFTAPCQLPTNHGRQRPPPTTAPNHDRSSSSPTPPTNRGRRPPPPAPHLQRPSLVSTPQEPSPATGTVTPPDARPLRPMAVSERLAAISNDTRDRIELLQVLILQGQRANYNPNTTGAVQLRANLLALQALLPQLYQGWTTAAMPRRVWKS